MKTVEFFFFLSKLDSCSCCWSVDCDFNDFSLNDFSLLLESDADALAESLSKRLCLAHFQRKNLFLGGGELKKRYCVFLQGKNMKTISFSLSLSGASHYVSLGYLGGAHGGEGGVGAELVGHGEGEGSLAGAGRSGEQHGASGQRALRHQTHHHARSSPRTRLAHQTSSSDSTTCLHRRRRRHWLQTIRQTQTTNVRVSS